MKTKKLKEKMLERENKRLRVKSYVEGLKKARVYDEFGNDITEQNKHLILKNDK